jgi:hypothetical protein
MPWLKEEGTKAYTEKSRQKDFSDIEAQCLYASVLWDILQ